MATTHWYVDDTASAGNDGTSPTDAWESIQTAMQYALFTLGNVNKVWIRRTTSFTFTASDIIVADDGLDDAPIEFIGWPRPAITNATITGADWTNGSNLVDNVANITPKREQHVGRFCTAPDGNTYLITAILYEAGLDGIEDGVSDFTVGSKLTNTTTTQYGKVWAYTDDGGDAGTIQYYRHPDTAYVENDNITDADSGDGEIDASGETAVGFIIDRKYAGSTVTTTNGKFQIDADPDYADRPTWAAADGDAIDLPIIDGNGLNFCLACGWGDEYFSFKNLMLKNAIDSIYGIMQIGHGCFIEGCLFSNRVGDNECLIYSQGAAIINRCILEGGGAGADAYNRGIVVEQEVAFSVYNCAVIGMGDCSLYSGQNDFTAVYLENVNFGIEAPDNDSNIVFSRDSILHGRDVNLGGDNGYYETEGQGTGPLKALRFENYQKVLGDHKTFYSGGEYISTVLTGATTPNKKLSDTVLKITPNINDCEFYVPDLIHRIPLGEINADAGSQTFSYWIHNLTGVTLNDTAATDDIFLQAEYVESYSATPTPDAYTMAIATSTLIDIVDQAGNPSTWVSLGVTCNPATESKVRLWVCVRIYDTNDIFIDPQVVIS